MDTENRVSPQAPEIEEAIIGACMIEQEALPLVADKLRPEMFYVERHRLIFSALLAMYQAGTKVDILTVKEELLRRKKRAGRIRSLCLAAGWQAPRISSIMRRSCTRNICVVR